jgi:hypothetical protein
MSDITPFNGRRQTPAAPMRVLHRSRSQAAIGPRFANGRSLSSLLWSSLYQFGGPLSRPQLRPDKNGALRLVSP